jgi:hypothetical protein
MITYSEKNSQDKQAHHGQQRYTELAGTCYSNYGISDMRNYIKPIEY